MTRKTIGLMAVTLLAAQGVLLQPAVGEPAASRQASAETRTCVTHDRGEPEATWTGRARAYCEVRWSDLVTHGSTGLWRHPDWVESCLRRCRADDLSARQVPNGPLPPDTAPILSAAAGVALATKAATTGSGPQPSPPASP